MEEDGKMQNHGTKGRLQRAVNRPAPEPGPQTMLALAQADLEKEKPINPAAAMTVQVVGATPIVNYPGNGLSDPVPDEPSLGYSIDDLPDMEKVER
jgi:hypothetical protein